MGHQQNRQSRRRWLLTFISYCRSKFSWSASFLLILTLQLSVSQITAAEQIRIITTNDLHTYLKPLYYRYLDELKPWGSQSREGDYVNKSTIEGKVGGMAHVATVIKNLRTETPGKNLVLDAGDTWHGAGISVFDKGVSMVKIMNAIGYDAMAPGNWEFMYSKDHLLDLIELAKFPIIAYNLTDSEWEEPVLDQYVIRQVGKLKVALVGMAYPWTALTSSAGGSANEFKFGIKENEAIDLLDEIRETEDPDLVIFVSHGGFGLDQKFARRVDGIDVYLSGHTHDEIYDPVVWNDTILFQGGAHGKWVVSLDLEVKDKKVVDYDYRLIKVMQKRISADPEIESIVEEAYRPHLEKLSEVIGSSKVMLYRRDYWQSTMGNFLTDALKEIAKADISFFPAWRYGATILPGKITVEDVYNVVPTDGKIITYLIKGKELKTVVENILEGVSGIDSYARVGGDMIRFSGMKLVCNLRQKSGQKILSMTVGGEPLSEGKDYIIASVHTRFQNNPLFGATGISDTGKVFVEELISYIRNNSPISSELDDRINLKTISFN